MGVKNTYEKDEIPCVIFSLTGVGVFELIALVPCLQCFDTVGWAAGKASGL